MMTSRKEPAATPDTTRHPAAASPITSSTHAYQVALSTLRERCRRQSEQLRTADVESRRLLADKAGLLEEIATLRETVGGHRERGTQLSGELSRQRRLAGQLLEQLSRRERLTSQLKRQLITAGLEPAADDDNSGETVTNTPENRDVGVGGEFETERDTDEMDVAGVTMTASYQQQQYGPQQHEDQQQQQTMSSEYDASHVIGARSADIGPTQCDSSTSEHLEDPSALVTELYRAAEFISARNAQLKLCIEHLSEMERVSNCSLPPLREIPLSSDTAPTGDDGGMIGVVPEQDLSQCDSSLICPLCCAVFADSGGPRDEFEEHVYNHLQQMVSAR